MNSVKILNLKCQGCERTIRSSLQKAGMENVSINPQTGKVSFEGNSEKAVQILSKLGYPKENSPRARSLQKKARSYISCAIGKTKK